MKKAVILGCGKSGNGAKYLLERKGYKCNIIDDFTNEKTNCKALITNADIVCLSPGFSNEHEWVKYAEQNNKRIISEIDLAYLECNNNTIIGISGTNGKTTVVTLLGKILNKYKKTHVVGNNGNAFSFGVKSIDDGDYVVVELSSFQLEQSLFFHPHIASILNITPDHLARHKTMENYARQKFKIFQNQTKNDYAILPWDDEMCKMFEHLVKSKKIYYSVDQEVDGAFVKEGRIFFKDKSIHEIATTEELNIKFEHNLKNVLVAICVCECLKIPIDIVKNAIATFVDLPHRMNLVKTINDITFINDSKSTNIDSAMCATKSFKGPIFALFGGFDKGLNFDTLIENLPKNVKMVVAFGQAKERIYSSCKKYNMVCEVTGTMNDAVKSAYLKAEKGDTILLSPACSSFDEFSSFEERGDAFVELVNSLTGGDIVNENKKQSIQDSKKHIQF